MNAAQLLAFEALRAMLPPAPASLANSGGLLLGPAYHFDSCVPAMRSTAARPRKSAPDPVQPVVRSRPHSAGRATSRPASTVGYSAT